MLSLHRQIKKLSLLSLLSFKNRKEAVLRDNILIVFLANASEQSQAYHFFLISVRPSRRGRMTRVTRGSCATKSLNISMPCVCLSWL